MKQIFFAAALACLANLYADNLILSKHITYYNYKKDQQLSAFKPDVKQIVLSINNTEYNIPLTLLI